MQVPFVDLKTQQQAVHEEVMAGLESVISNANFILGDQVSEFEAAFADYCGVEYAIGVDSGHSALKLALLALGIKPGDEVIVPANTFIATAAAVSFTGAIPVFVDMHVATNNINVDLIEAAITPRTRAIVPVHLYGSPADMAPILEIARAHNLYVVEDAAQAHGARYNGQRVGSMGHAAGFSFYPAKNLGAGGDAGMVTTNDPDVAERVRGMRNVGQLEKNLHTLAPYNHRMDTLQAVVLAPKLKRLDHWNACRQEHAAKYDQLLDEIGVERPAIVNSGSEQVWHLYVIRVDNRDGLRSYLAEQGIATGIHYPVPLHLQPYYEHLGYRCGDFPVAESVADRIVSLPMYPEMTDESIERVAGAIKRWMQA